MNVTMKTTVIQCKQNKHALNIVYVFVSVAFVVLVLGELTLFCLSFVEPKLSSEWKALWTDMVDVVERGLCPSGQVSRLEKYLLLLLSWKKLRRGGREKPLYIANGAKFH